jgi:hypothetical protein
MDEIYETNHKFNFNELHIGKPLSSSAGVFMCKYSIHEKSSLFCVIYDDDDDDDDDFLPILCEKKVFLFHFCVYSSFV